MPKKKKQAKAVDSASVRLSEGMSPPLSLRQLKLLSNPRFAV
jgi:hypothetical protein